MKESSFCNGAPIRILYSSSDYCTQQKYEHLSKMSSFNSILLASIKATVQDDKILVQPKDEPKIQQTRNCA